MPKRQYIDVAITAKSKAQAIYLGFYFALTPILKNDLEERA
jgi:hypothetical protein